MDNERARSAREAGGDAVRQFRRALESKAAELIRSDPDEAAAAIEMGLIDKRWLDQPGDRPVSTSSPTEIVERFLERAVERRPSRLGTLGLSALQLLGADRTSSTGTAHQLAVIFTDLEGFTAFTDAHGDDAALELINRHHRAAGPVVRQWGGHIVKHLGDGLLCTFADPEAAVLAALDLLATAPEPLRLRAGGHLGEAIVSHGDVVGHVVNVAARVTETAKGGEVVITVVLAEAAGEVAGVGFSKSRSRRLKGVSERVEVCRVTRRSPALPKPRDRS